MRFLNGLLNNLLLLRRFLQLLLVKRVVWVEHSDFVTDLVDFELNLFRELEIFDQNSLSLLLF